MEKEELIERENREKKKRNEEIEDGKGTVGGSREEGEEQSFG